MKQKIVTQKTKDKIIAYMKKGDKSLTEAGKKFKLTKSTISRILNNK